MFARSRAFLSSIILFFVGLALIFALVYCIKVFFYEKNMDIPIHRVDTNEKNISLTFDVSYSDKKINDILYILDKYDVKVTFFVVGKWVDKNQNLVEEIHKRGHEIANHSNSHTYFNEISEEEIKNELQITSQKIENITGSKTNLFRPPFGEINEKEINICQSLGYKVIKWDVDSMDWKNIDSKHVVDRVLKSTSSGSIILFHCDRRDVDEYLEQIICHFEKNKYNMVRLSDLIYQDNYYIDSSGVQRLK